MSRNPASKQEDPIPWSKGHERQVAVVHQGAVCVVLLNEQGACALEACMDVRLELCYGG